MSIGFITSQHKPVFRINRSSVQNELISDVLDLAKKKSLLVGPIVRQWVQERLQQEKRKSRVSQLDVIEEKIDRLAAVVGSHNGKG